MTLSLDRSVDVWNMIKNMASIVMAFALTLTVNAQEDFTKYGIADKDAPQGLEIGSELPLVKGKLANNELVSLDELQENGSLVVVFFRGSWCPYCNQHLAVIADSMQFFSDKKARVVAITPEMGEQEEFDESGITFLHDYLMELMQTFDVDFHVTEGYQNKLMKFKHIDLAEHNGQQQAILPVPGTFIFDKEGKLVARFVDVNYKERPSAAWILENLP